MVHVRIIRVVIFLSCVLLTAVPSFAVPVAVSARRIQQQPTVPLLDPGIWSEREKLIKGISDNIEFLKQDSAVVAYQQLSVLGISQKRMLRSLERFRELLSVSQDFAAFQKGLQREFVLVKSPGRDGRGTVRFTGYYQPTLKASRVRDEVYRFPIYKLPENFNKWSRPHPTRIALEGYQGTGAEASPLKGLELAYLPTRFDAFSAHLQGSAILEFGSGDRLAACFAAGTSHPFRGFSRSFLEKHKVSWNNLGEFFESHPKELDQILAKNNRYIFFKECQEPFPLGSLGVPVIAERSMATDKVRLPPAGLGIVRTQIPQIDENGKLSSMYATRLVLDQDSGSAIKGPGRVDLYMGSGNLARMKASSIFGDGALYYLLHRE